MSDKLFTPSERQRELLSVVYDAFPNPISIDEVCEILNREKRLVGTTLKSLVKREIINKSNNMISLNPDITIHEDGTISFEEPPTQTSQTSQTSQTYEPEVSIDNVSPLIAPHPPLEEESIFNPDLPQDTTPETDRDPPITHTDSHNTQENTTYTETRREIPDEKIPSQDVVDDNMYQEPQNIRKRTSRSQHEENYPMHDDEPDIIPEIRSPHEVLSDVLRKNDISEVFIEKMYDLSLDQGILQPAELHLYLTTLRARKTSSDKAGGSLKDAEASFIIRQYSRELERERRKADRLNNLSQQFKLGSTMQPDYFTEQTPYPVVGAPQSPYNRQSQYIPYNTSQPPQQGYNQYTMSHPNPLYPNRLQQNPQQQTNQPPPVNYYPQPIPPQPQGITREDIVYLQNEMQRNIAESIREERERFNKQLEEERRRNAEEKNSFIELIREMKEERKEDRIAEAINEIKNVVARTENEKPRDDIKEIIEAITSKSESQIGALIETMQKNLEEERERRKDELYQRQLDELREERRLQERNMERIISQLGKRNSEDTISAYTDDIARLKAHGFQTIGDAVNKVADNKPLIILGSKALKSNEKESTEGEFEQYSDDTSEEVIENIPTEYIE